MYSFMFIIESFRLLLYYYHFQRSLNNMTNKNIKTIDFLIKNAKVFNDTEAPRIEDVAIAKGKIVDRGQDLNYTNAEKVIDAKGLWLMPGLFDIHTHYDLELEVAPALPV